MKKVHTEGKFGKPSEYAEPGAAYKGITMHRTVKSYGDEFSDAVRQIKHYSKKELSELTNGEVNAEKLWSHLNVLAGRYLGTNGLDPNDHRYKAVYAQINSAVKRFGTAGITSDLLETVIGQYIQVARAYASEKARGYFAQLPAGAGKKELMLYAKAGGVIDEFEDQITGAKDPTDVEQIAAQIDEAVSQKVVSLTAHNKFPKLEEIVKGDESRKAA